MSDPRGDCCIHNRLLARKQLHSLRLRGHHESILIAHLSGAPLQSITQQYRVSSEFVKNLISDTVKSVEKLHKKGRQQ